MTKATCCALQDSDELVSTEETVGEHDGNSSEVMHSSVAPTTVETPGHQLHQASRARIATEEFLCNTVTVLYERFVGRAVTTIWLLKLTFLTASKTMSKAVGDLIFIHTELVGPTEVTEWTSLQ